MKSYLITTLFLFNALVILAQVNFEQSDILLKDIYSGQKISRTVRFQNTSNRPIKIKNVKTSCGCFVGDWKVKEVQPLQWDSIKFTFDSRGKMSRQTKTARINFENIDSTFTLSFHVFVKPSLINIKTINKHQQFVKEKKEYHFQMINIGDSLVYIDRISTSIYEQAMDSLKIKYNYPKTIHQGDTVNITATIIDPTFDFSSDIINYYDINVYLKDCLGLTKSWVNLSISEER